MNNPNLDLLKKKAEKARLKLGVSHDDAELIANHAYQLYNYFGHDLPAETKRGIIKRSSLIEVCLDAGHLQEKLSGRLNSPAVPHAAQLVSILDKADYKTKIDLVGPAFTYAEYEAGPADM